MTAIIWPFVAYYIDLGLALTLLSAALLGYCLSEYLRLNGMTLPAFGPVTRLTLRLGERRRFAAAPVALALGVMLALLFPHPVPFLAVSLAAFGDSAASLVGQLLGRRRLPYSHRKTLEGTLGALAFSTLICHLFLPWPKAFLLAFFAAFAESLPLGDWDNFLVPVACALFSLALL